jgi:hypothetical protein
LTARGKLDEAREGGTADVARLIFYVCRWPILFTVLGTSTPYIRRASGASAEKSVKPRLGNVYGSTHFLMLERQPS